MRDGGAQWQAFEIHWESYSDVKLNKEAQNFPAISPFCSCTIPALSREMRKT